MSDVPSNLIPTRITHLPIAPEASEDSLMMIVYNGNNYQINPPLGHVRNIRIATNTKYIPITLNTIIHGVYRTPEGTA